MQATVSGHPVLEFLNTVSDNGKTRSSNSFDTGEDLVRQLRNGGLAYQGEPPATGQLRGLLQLREAAYAVFSALSADRQPPLEDTLTVEAAIKSALSDARLVPTRDASTLWRAGPLGGLHDTLALSIAGLLQSPSLHRLKECRRCTHLFLDHGRGPGRRWCSMARCGNRSKVQGFRDRQRARA